jgi:hypothetical protein
VAISVAARHVGLIEHLGLSRQGAGTEIVVIIEMLDIAPVGCFLTHISGDLSSLIGLEKGTDAVIIQTFEEFPSPVCATIINHDRLHVDLLVACETAIDRLLKVVLSVVGRDDD